MASPGLAFCARGDDPDPGGIYVDAVAMPFLYDFGIARSDLDPSLLAGIRHGERNAPQGFHLQAFLEDKTC